jgi:hypothetical protein
MDIQYCVPSGGIRLCSGSGNLLFYNDVPRITGRSSPPAFPGAAHWLVKTHTPQACWLVLTHLCSAMDLCLSYHKREGEGEKARGRAIAGGNMLFFCRISINARFKGYLSYPSSLPLDVRIARTPFRRSFSSFSLYYYILYNILSPKGIVYIIIII